MGYGEADWKGGGKVRDSLKMLMDIRDARSHMVLFMKSILLLLGMTIYKQ